jgi:hypothetical protein
LYEDKPQHYENTCGTVNCRSISSLDGSYMQANAPNMSKGIQVALSAVIGGTAEALGGGKFSNGAVTRAYVMMLNHLGSEPQTRPIKHLLNENQIKQLQQKIKRATFSHRSSWANYDPNKNSNMPNWDVSMEIDGVEGGTIYTAENVEIWLGNETLIVDIDYFPNTQGSWTNMIDEPLGKDLSPNGRLWFYTKDVGRGQVLQINFHNRIDFDNYNRFIMPILKKN